MDNIIKEEIQEREKFLEAIVDEKREALRKVPNGRLKITRRGKNVQYYHIQHNEKYIRAENRDLAAALA